jgi:polar amino acid transport system substrate-binding protein
MKRIQKIIFAVTLLFIGLIGSTSVSHADTVYKIGAETDYAPFNYVENDKHVGFDYDLMNEIAKLQGLKIEWYFDSFNNITRDVANGKLDGIMSGFLISDVREEAFDFSHTIIEHGSVYVVRNDENITSVKGLNGKRIGAMENTQSHIYLRDHQQLHDFHLATFENSEQLFEALETGKVDAIINATPVINYQLYKKSGYHVIQVEHKATNMGSVGFAVKKGENANLLGHFNVGLKQTEGNGTLNKLSNKYFHITLSRRQVESITLPKTDKSYFSTHMLIVAIAIIIVGIVMIALIIKLRKIAA